MRKIKDFFNNNKTLAIAMTAALALTVVGAIIFANSGDDSDTNETTATETTTADVQLELTKVDDAIRDEDGNLTTVTVEGKTYDLTTDLKEKIEVDANTTGYIMNDGTTFYEKYSGMVYYETEVTTSPIENDSNVSTNADETSTTVVADVDSSDSTDSTDSSETETTTVTIADTNTTEAQTTTAKKEESTTKKEEPTTAKKEQQTTAAVVKHESGRLKDCELKLFSQLLDCENLNSNGDWVPALYYDLPYGATEANKFEYVNYRYQALGFDNVHIVSDTGLYDWNRYDDFENSDNLNDEYKNLSAIYAVTDSDFNYDTISEICKKLLIAESDYEEFKSYYDEAKKNKETVYLFRFDQNEYISEVATFFEVKERSLDVKRHIDDPDKQGYFFSMTAHLDFLTKH